MLQKLKRKNEPSKSFIRFLNYEPWLTGINESTLKKYLSEEITFELFFQHAKLHPNAHKITGTICGKRIKDIEDELTKKVRYLDKLVDELAKGKSLDVICRE
jgi:hypothetical protein